MMIDKIKSFLLLLLLPLTLSAQITIGGNIYGGGNAGNTSGNATVNIYAGDIDRVFGGARRANVGGRTFLNIDGEKAASGQNILINQAYGGNDIAGTIGTSTADFSSEFKHIKTLPADASDPDKNAIDKTWNCMVQVKSKTTHTEKDANNTSQDALFIGSLYGGSNGDYFYTDDGSEYKVYLSEKEYNDHEDQPLVTSTTSFITPEIDKTYLEILGGTIGYVFGGGNNATVRENTLLYMNNGSAVVNHLYKDNVELLSDERIAKMGFNFSYNSVGSDAFQVGNCFGGNNKVAMRIRPNWNLQAGKIRNLYSGGNEGDMTCETGLLLEINPLATNTDPLVVDNVFGGCRKANVRPMSLVTEGAQQGTYVDVSHVYNIDGYYFPAEFAARTLIRGGDINNVYGGNDISGRVHFGNAIGIYTSIRGDVYGGGNGSYPFTDNSDLANNPTYSDFYYNPQKVLEEEKITGTPEKLKSAKALYYVRPDAEQVSIRIAGTDEKHPTIIGGSIYCGGNSATLMFDEDHKSLTNYPIIELKIGSHAIANNVFLGNNGENMVKNETVSDILQVMNSKIDSDSEFNSIDLKDEDVFAEYMKGCALDLMPRVVFDNTENDDPATYIPYSSYIGSFYCGGNVGSMTKADATTINFNGEVVIFDKVVGGCNSAQVFAKSGCNAGFQGGVIGSDAERSKGIFEDDYGNIKNRMVLNFSNLKLQPKRWKFHPIANGTTLTANTEYYTSQFGAGKFKAQGTEVANGTNYFALPELEWNTIDSESYNPATKTYAPMEPVAPGVVSGDGEIATHNDIKRRLNGGHIYGGCYESGIVNGNVVINLNNSIVDRDRLFDVVKEDEDGEAILYGHEQYHIVERKTGVLLDEQGMDVLGVALNVFGGGKGKDTEIWGSTVINLNGGYTFQIFGGSEEGVIGKSIGKSSYNDYTYDPSTGEYSFNGKLYKFNPKYSCYVNLCGTKAGVSKKSDQSEKMAECEFMYGGGFFGPICGNTVINLGQGRIFNSFAGSCNGDILGTAETFIGRQVRDEYRTSRPDNVLNQDVFEPGFPWVRDIVYGANDLGGRILGVNTYADHIRGQRTWDTDYTTGFDAYSMMHSHDGDDADSYPDVVQASAYVEYLQGRADAIFGGCYGTYDYKDTKFSRYTYTATKDAQDNIIYSDGATAENLGEPRSVNGSPIFFKPRLNNAFVNFRPTYKNNNNVVKKVYGAGQGQEGETDRDLLQNRSYVLIDIPNGMGTYENMEVFGAGAWGGVGMVYDKATTQADGFDLDKASAIIDLLRGNVKNVFGGSFIEGVTRRTVVNVPDGSVIKVDSIFGGAYGADPNIPCDVYEAKVNYHSEAARVNTIFGGNNFADRTLYGQVNIDVPVWSKKNTGDLAYVFGAGCGPDTWSQYTEVNLNSGAKVYEVYGGGMNGMVLNLETMREWKETLGDLLDLSLPGYEVTYEKGGKSYQLDDGLNSPLVHTASLDGRKYNTNVHINEGATVANYAYGGGLGVHAVVSGTTYIDLLGGTVNKDIYAAGTSGSIIDKYGAKDFTASATTYIKGGTVRNVFGGGWRGSVGYHEGKISDVANNINDVFGETHVVIGDIDGTSYLNGIPSITRNVYGGGEGGAIYGTAYVTVNNGYMGYRFKGSDPTTANAADFHEELDDVAAGDSLLYRSGNVFGGGYVANSEVDNSDIKMYGGTVRGSLYGGGELGPIGRGTMKADALAPAGTIVTSGAKIYKAGTTLLEMFGGHVLRNVFGGGRGYDNWGGEGYMTDAEKLTMDRSAKGYVFGLTRVNIRGGEIGTDEGMAENFGNVFGGSDVGYVYSANGLKYGNRFDGDGEGYYYQVDENGEYVTNAGSKILVDCCKVTVGPHCKVTAAGGITLTNIVYPQGATIPAVDMDYLKAHNLNQGDYTTDGRVTNASGITIASRTYQQGDYVPTYALHTLKDKNTDPNWGAIDDDGIIIHNAVFAGGNVSAGSTEVFANTTTVFGNATASIHDVYHRDLITIGTGHTGGLYGDGNLTFVDGYRGLNITNYGTDYYNITMEIPLETYKSLPKREQAYYELKYSCIKECTDINGKTYHPGEGSLQASTITADEMLLRFEGTSMLDAEGKPDPTYWKENGVCSRYAGRIMNTIQRADFCGVFGSRMVMQGAKDRVPEVVDNANYTINRVREVSLNKKVSVIPGDATEEKHKFHGNYFGIYSNVNFLGALTSDVFFTRGSEKGDLRTTNMTDNLAADGKTFYEWKEANKTKRIRNRGTCHNEVALASGVYLELTNENGRGTGINEKEWGYVTGVIVLDLINVQQGIGGGFVYAKNEHGIPSYSHKEHATLTALNANAVTRKDFSYTTEDDSKKEWETSGNFIHDTQTIIDDCYPVSNRYKGAGKVPAHYWYIKGTVYVYDQYISAYTGAANAYSKAVNIPLTISAASHGMMRLADVKPNRYAYYSDYKSGSGKKLGPDDVLELNGKTYKLNDPINYWDYNLLNASGQRLFVDKTYVTIAECQTGGKTYPAGYVMLQSEYDALRDAAPEKTIEGVNVKAVTSHDRDVAFDFVFRESNNLRHDTGYILTYDVNNPKIWDKWYTPESGAASAKININDYNNEAGYHNGPTYKPITPGLYGQQSYKEGAIISQKVYDDYETLKTEHSGAIPTNDPENTNYKAELVQATFVPACVVTKAIELTDGEGRTVHLYPGATVPEGKYSSNVTPAFVCTSTLELEDKSLLLINTVMTEDEKNQYQTNNPSLYATIEEVVKPAYYCTSAGLYGGDYYDTTKNYRGLAAWSSMSEADREHFEFNYDALDLLIDQNFGGRESMKYQYDGQNFNTSEQAKTNAAQYSLIQPVDYTATYNGSEAMPYTDKSGTTQTVAVNAELGRVAFEALPNEQRHFTAIKIPKGITEYTVHVVNKSFIHGDSPYAAGQTMTNEEYKSMNETDLPNITTLEFTSSDADSTYFFCRESYIVNENGEGRRVTNIKAGTGYNSEGEEVALTANQSFETDKEVPIGVLIRNNVYESLTNRQKEFTIHGTAPTETSTLYVSRQSDIYDLSSEKIITVIYEYDYEEADESGAHITPVSERHVVNIHIDFQSGVPTVEDISAPKIVLPGTLVNLRTPNVTPGAYEVTGGGWMLFEKEDDTDSHSNGIEYTPTTDPLYWYQDGYYVAYYAQTYLGRTFSNAVPVSVANYHDLADVMSDKNKTHHMYIDDKNVKRDPKIYITTADGLSLFKNLYDLSVLDGSPIETNEDGIITQADSPFKGHALLDPQVRAGQNLELFLRTDLSVPSGSPAWTPIGTDASSCFEGNLHGDGHTISGLTNSLFNHLCGNVYNLGVTGSFTGAGIAETGKGYVENCWVSSSSTAAKTTQPVFGNPTRTGDKLIQVVNSYYHEEDDVAGTAGSYTKQVTDHNDSSHGTPIRKPLKAFYNGEVAYDLNGFYLYQRYCDNVDVSVLGGSPAEYKSWQPGKTTPQTIHYGTDDPTLCSAVYVKERFTDGDFIYSNGTIPETEDERLYVDAAGTRNYYPIWPDDYLFFGQALNYGHMDGNNGRDLRSPQEWPSALNKSDGRILATLQGNRVYRAPAYFRSGTMNVAHFNQHAVFAQSKNGDPATLAYKDMTAIDFTGHNDPAYAKGQSSSFFYPPLLDDDGLKGFYNVDLTSNLLVYTGNVNDEGAPAATATTVMAALPDGAYTETNPTYKTVDTWDRFSGVVRGHWVQKTGEEYIAPNDHLLVDRQDFNAPIAYRMAADKRIWYQRDPDRFVDRTKGWDAVSLPFTADIVTTNQKGEITHFYSESKSSDKNTKLGHEYWLREFTGIKTDPDPSNPALASFTYPTALSTDLDKTVTNTFLWDYYYEASSGHNHLDKNTDTYQTYYSEPRQYYNYARLTAATPYIIGLPGVTYYEFDLSGTWSAQTTAEPNPLAIGKQSITFASAQGASIGVSDSEMEGKTIKHNSTNYTFKPNYLNMAFEAGTDNYLLDNDGDSFDKVPAASTPPADPVPATSLSAFRPYFTSATASSVKNDTRSIIFSSIDDNLAPDEDTEPDNALKGSLDIQARGRRIIVTSYLDAETTIHIFTSVGALLDTYTIAPGQIIETRVNNTGVYLVRPSHNPKSLKKLSIK